MVKKGKCHNYTMDNFYVVRIKRSTLQCSSRKKIQVANSSTHEKSSYLQACGKPPEQTGLNVNFRNIILILLILK